MQYGQTVLFIAICFLIYYVVMIFMDIQKANAAKVLEAENNKEEDIDISDEAKQFIPVRIVREEKPKKQEVNADADNTEAQKGNTAKSGDAKQANAQPADKEEDGNGKQKDAETSKQEGGQEQPMTSQSQQVDKQPLVESEQPEEESPRPISESESPEEDEPATLDDSGNTTQSSEMEQFQNGEDLPQNDERLEEAAPAPSPRRVPALTDNISIDALLVEVDKLAETGKCDLSNIMFECNKEMHNI